MWTRAVVGVALILLGALWIGQGVGAVHGSGMTGHGQYAVLGAIVAAVGALLLLWAGRLWAARRRRP